MTTLPTGYNATTKLYSCLDCSKQFIYEKVYRKHQHQHALLPTEFICIKCGFKCTEKKVT